MQTKWALLLAAARLLLMLAAARLLLMLAAARLLLTLAAAVLLLAAAVLLLAAAVLLLLRRWAGVAAAEPLLMQWSCCSSLESPLAFVVLRAFEDVL